MEMEWHFHFDKNLIDFSFFATEICVVNDQTFTSFNNALFRLRISATPTTFSDILLESVRFATSVTRQPPSITVVAKLQNEDDHERKTRL